MQQMRTPELRLKQQKKGRAILCLVGLGLLVWIAAVYGVNRSPVSQPTTSRSVSSQSAQGATAPRVLLDVPGVMGRSPAEVRGVLGDPTEAKRCVAGYLEASPATAAETRAYRPAWGYADATFVAGRVIALYVSFNQGASYATVDEALRAVSLPAGRRPDRYATPRVRVFDNLAGYNVTVGGESADRPDAIALVNIRPYPLAKSTVPSGPPPYCTPLPA